MDSKKKSKGVQQWCITLNFPSKQQGDCKIPNQEIVKQIIANVQRKPHKTIYIRWTTQIGGDKKKLHLQMYLQCTKPMQLDQVKKFYFKDVNQPGVGVHLDRQRSPTAIKADEYLDGPTCVAPATSGTSLCGKPTPCTVCKKLWTQKNFDKIIWSYKYGERDDNLAPAPGQGKRTDLDKLLEVKKNVEEGKWGVKEVYNNVPHLLGKGIAINYWLAKASSLEQSIIMRPKWNDDPMKDTTMVQILKYINTTQDNRSILWIWSNMGKTGKSTMITWMANKLKMMGREVFMSSGGKDGDIAHMYDEQCYCFFDFPRSETAIPYSFIEQLKNGNVTSTKYQTKAKKPRDRHGILKFPWVIVVANQGPSMERLSKDRCKVICLDRPGHRHDAPVVPDQEHRVEEQEPEEWNELGPVADIDMVDWKWENPKNGEGKLINKMGPIGELEELKRVEAKVPIRSPSTQTIRREHKSENSDEDSETEVINPYPPNKSTAPSPKGLLKEVKSYLNKGDAKRGEPQPLRLPVGLGLGGGPPPQQFNTILRKPKKLTTKTPQTSPASNPRDIIVLDDDEPVPVLTIKKEGAKPPKRTLINTKKRVRGGGPEPEEEPTQLAEATPDHPDKDEGEPEWSQSEIEAVMHAQETADYDDFQWQQDEYNRHLRQSKKQRVEEITPSQEAAQQMTALIADKKAKAKEKLASKHLSLQARLAKED